MNKKYILGVLAIISLGILFLPMEVSAARYDRGPVCNPGGNFTDDVNKFPYGFMCGTHPDYHAPIILAINGDANDPAAPFTAGDTIRVNAIYGSGITPVTGSPRKNGDTAANSAVLFVTINTASRSTASGLHPQNITPANGNASLGCPGDGSRNVADGPTGPNSGPGKVYGNRDISGDYDNTSLVNGNDQSPYAYVRGQSNGVINCQDSGRMVYWRINNPSSSGNGAFDLKIDDDVESGRICMRTDYAIAFDNDERLFPPSSSGATSAPGSPGSAYSGAYNSKITATHIVKQSEERCFQVVKPPPLGWRPTLQASCSRLSGVISFYNAGGSVNTNVHDTRYKMQLWDPLKDNGPGNPVGGFNDMRNPNTNAIWNYSDSNRYWDIPVNGATLFGHGTMKGFRMVIDPIYDGGPSTGWQYKGWDTGSELDCLPYPPELNYSLTCAGGIVGNASDRDTAASGVVTIQIYEGASQLAQFNTNSSGDFSWDVSGYRDGNDHTFSVGALDDSGASAGTWIAKLMDGCGRFTLEPGAGGSLLPSDEDPTDFRVLNTVTVSYPGWVNATKPAVGPDPRVSATNWLTKDGGGITGTGFPTYTTFIDRDFNSNYAIPAGSFVAGNSYCSNITIGPYQGLIQRNNGQILAITQASKTVSGCDTVNNKPFFKVYGGSVSAGGNFTETGSCSGGGVLSGFYRNDSVNPAFKYGQGSSTELAALGIGQVTGFASAQKNVDKSPIELTFANQGVTWPIQSDPKLGGLYGGDHCLDNAEPPSRTGAVTEERSGDYTLPPGSVSNNKSIFVKGDVYVTADGAGNAVIYSGAGDANGNGGTWTVDTVPSFVLKAEGGNIYIDNDVKVMDGLYIAEATAAAQNKGQIYTCSSALGVPVGQNDLYDNCYKQLTVHGSFVARKVNMMRTYGSLRDEKPTAGTPKVDPGPDKAGLKNRPKWSENSIPDGYFADECIEVFETAESPSGIWTDNYLCLSSLDMNAGVEIGWSSSGGTPKDTSNKPMVCENLAFIKRLGESPAHTWGDNNLCSNLGTTAEPGITVGTAYNLAQAEAAIGGPWLCDQMYDNGDSHIPYWQQNNNIKIYICLKKFVAGGGGRDAVLPVANNPLICSNSRPGSKSFSPATGRRDTCAAEVFDFSPEFYLAQPSINPPSGGAIIYDAITSLPPVL